MKLNLQLKQFDINSQVAQQNLNQFTTLLQLGAYDNASGEDLASITRATGMPSSFVQSAINFNKKKNVQTSTISFDDGTNQGFAIINSQTGEVISKQNVAASKPTAGAKESEYEIKQTNLLGLKEDIASGRGVREVFGTYGGLLPPDDIISIYNTLSPHGTAYESPEELGKYGVDIKKYRGY